MEKGVPVNAFMIWSQLQPNGLFRHQNFDLQIYRDCTPNNGTNNKMVITGNTIFSTQYVITVPQKYDMQLTIKQYKP